MPDFARNSLLSGLLACLVGSCSGPAPSQTTNPKLMPPAAVKLQDKPELACRLTTPELQRRQATVLASLKSQVVTKKELPDGFAFEFASRDAVLDELLAFIKTERQCCGFFTFRLVIQQEPQTAWLEIRGPEGVKELIGTELAL